MILLLQAQCLQSERGTSIQLYNPGVDIQNDPLGIEKYFGQITSYMPLFLMEMDSDVEILNIWKNCRFPGIVFDGGSSSFHQ